MILNMSTWEGEDDSLALFLEAQLSDKEPDKIDKNEEDEGPAQKRRPCVEVEGNVTEERKLTRFPSSSQVRNSPSSRSKRAGINSSGYCVEGGNHDRIVKSKRTDNSFLSQVPPEVFHDILKFLSSEDLVACSQRDEEEMVQFVRNCPSEFKEYYIQMQAAKRCQAPIPSQDDWMILDKTVADEVSTWKSSKGLTDQAVTDHACSGKNCSYHQIGDVYVCEKTGNIHVCDDTCKDASADLTNGLLVCTISGHCFERLMSPTDEEDQDTDQQQDSVSDEAETFMGSGRYARAYSLGYNCADERELEACLQFC